VDDIVIDFMVSFCSERWLFQSATMDKASATPWLEKSGNYGWRERRQESQGGILPIKSITFVT
jgi:hypothetical protein